jgi:integrase
LFRPYSYIGPLYSNQRQHLCQKRNPIKSLCRNCRRPVYSKTNQSGQDRFENNKPLLGLASDALRSWLEVSGITEGRIFRRVLKGGHLGSTLSASAVRDIVKTRCVLAGVEGDYSAHSLRSGFVTEAARQNVPLAETMAMTGHHSVASLMGYFRAESSLESKASKLI